MKELYQKIIEILTSQLVKDEFVENGLKPIQTIDLYKGQYQAWEEFELIPLPAVLIDWSVFEGAQGNNKDNRQLSLTLHLIYEQVQDTSNFGDLTTSLRFFDFIELVQKHIGNLKTEKVGNLIFISQQPVALDRPGIVHSISYNGVFYGFSTDPKDDFDYTAENESDLDLSGELVKSIDRFQYNPFD
ncbi:MAG: hypothetical protein PHQ74_15140 [Crocinitomicaceae bacterium]|nr:hypothetical protein [Crocinitomicaceae bacterium]